MVAGGPGEVVDVLGGHAAERTAFLRMLDADLNRDVRSVTVVRIDLDRFSRIRQTFGTPIARLVRTELVRRLEAIVGGPERLLRYGEDAFIAILRVEDPSPESLERASMAIIDSLSAPMEIDGERIAVGCNVGLAAAAHFDETEPLRLLTGAELAIQRANAIGSRRAIVYEVAQVDDPTRLPMLFADMLGAIGRGEFTAAFQPVVSLPDRRIIGAEALVRWSHPTHGLLQPVEFIPEAETSGLVRQIDAVVREDACRVFAALPADLGLSVSVNLSAADLDAPSLADDVAATLQRWHLPAGRLVLEVTETALSQDWSRAQRRLRALKALGIRLAVDDFGTGHMFLDRLSTGLFDILKVDRSLVVPEDEDLGRRATLLTAVTSLAHALSMDTVAEGVETEAQLTRVVDAGCTRAQGYLFSPAVPAETFVHLVGGRGTIAG